MDKLKNLNRYYIKYCNLKVTKRYNNDGYTYILSRSSYEKNIFYIIIISIIIGLCACHNTENNGTSNIETVLYRTAEDGSIFDIERTTEFDTKEYIDNSAAKTIELKIFRF